MSVFKRALYCFLVAVTCLALFGCGPGGGKRVKVTGKIVEGGQPLTITETEARTGGAPQVTFYQLDSAGNIPADGKSYSTTARQDGTFEMTGDDGKGIPVGKYRVTLRGKAPGGYSPTAQGQGDRWGGKFDATKSPFTFDFQSDQTIELNLDTAGGAAPTAEKTEKTQ